MERFFRYDQICVEKLPLMKILEKQAKKWIFLISPSKYQKYTKFTSRYMFVDDKCDAISKTFLGYHQRRQNPRWPLIMVK